jgi:hypothetical protein
VLLLFPRNTDDDKMNDARKNFVKPVDIPIIATEEPTIAAPA